MKKILLTLAVASLFVGLGVSAQTPTLYQNQGDNLGMQINAVRAGVPRMASTSEALKQAREQIRIEKDAFKSKMETLKAEVKTKRDQERTALKNKLNEIKDSAKKAAVQRLDENINKLNSNFVEKWTKNLSDFDTNLSRLIDRASTTSATTTDLTAFTAAVDAARAAIASARTALQAQAQKTYSLAVSTEANLKVDVSAVRESLNWDLKAVKDLVQNAHLSLVKVLTEFNKIK